MASPQKATILEGRKIVIRDKRVTDAPKDYAWSSDSEIMRLDAADYIPVSYSVFLVKYAEGLHDLTKHQFAIETHDGKHIGNCVCYNLHNSYGEAELGIVIGDRDYWGKGYGSDAVVTLARYIFEALEIKRICLHTLTWNIRAQRCFEKCGFVACGREKRNGREFVEMELYRKWLKPENLDQTVSGTENREDVGLSRSP